MKLLRRLVSLSCLLSLVNSLASATIADKDGSIKASDEETARLAALLWGLSCTSRTRSRTLTRSSDRATPRRGARLDVETA